MISLKNLPKLSEETPKGKRSIRRTIYGNLNGYVSGKFWVTFGEAYTTAAEEKAEEWMKENV